MLLSIYQAPVIYYTLNNPDKNIL